MEGPNGPLIRMAGGIPIPTDNFRSMVQFREAMEEVFVRGDWMHFSRKALCGSIIRTFDH